MQELLEANEIEFQLMITSFIELLKSYSITFLIILGFSVAVITVARWHRARRKHYF